MTNETIVKLQATIARCEKNVLDAQRLVNDTHMQAYIRDQQAKIVRLTQQLHYENMLLATTHKA